MPLKELKNQIKIAFILFKLLKHLVFQEENGNESLNKKFNNSMAFPFKIWNAQDANATESIHKQLKIALCFFFFSFFQNMECLRCKCK